MKLALRRRRGTIVSEALAAMALATIAAVSVAQLLAVTSRQWTSAQQRAVAAREAGNSLEELFARPWTELTAEKLRTIALPANTRDVLPDAKLQITLAGDKASSEGVRIQVRIDWRNAAGQRATPVQLVAWRFRTEETVP